MTETNNTTNNQIDIVDNTNGLYKVNDVFYTASDGSAKELFGVRRYVYSCAYGIASDKNFADVLKGPQNITICEMVGAAICIVQAAQMTEFRDITTKQIHCIDNFNAVCYLKALQTAARNHDDMKSNLIYTLMTEEAPWTEVMLGLTTVLAERDNLEIKWQPSHTDLQTHEAKMNDQADVLCSRHMGLIYETYPRTLTTDQEIEHLAQLPPEQRRFRLVEICINEIIFQ